MPAPPAPPALIAVARGLRARCPACGKGRLFSGYLEQAPVCTACGAETGRIEAEDGPPWLTVLMLGPLLAALTFGISMHEGIPFWVAFPAMAVVAILAVLALLPRVKGGLIGALWQMRARD